jgi:hypothetical protein
VCGRYPYRQDLTSWQFNTERELKGKGSKADTSAALENYEELLAKSEAVFYYHCVSLLLYLYKKLLLLCRHPFDCLSIFAQGAVDYNPTPIQMTFFKLLGGVGNDNSTPSTTVEIRYKGTASKSDKNNLVNDAHHFPGYHPILLTKPRQQTASTVNQKGSSYYSAVAT